MVAQSILTGAIPPKAMLTKSQLNMAVLWLCLLWLYPLWLYLLWLCLLWLYLLRPSTCYGSTHNDCTYHSSTYCGYQPALEGRAPAATLSGWPHTHSTRCVTSPPAPGALGDGARLRLQLGLGRQGTRTVREGGR